MCKLYFQFTSLILAYVLFGNIGILVIGAIYIAEYKYKSKPKLKKLRYKVTVNGKDYFREEIIR